MRNWYSTPTFPQNLESPSARSLSLLFILQEWILGCQWIKKAKETPGEWLTNPITEKGGKLDKLCFYSEILLQASKSNGESLLMVLEDIRHLFAQLRTKAFCAQEFPSEWVQWITQKFYDFFSSLTPFLQEARTDENVLIYLIEHKDVVNSLLGPHAVEHLLHQLFPSGQPHLRAVICEGFTRRGFSSFLAEKEPLIEELEWPQIPPSN